MTELNGQLTIPCSAETGIEFTNTQSGDVTFKFTPSGSFSAASFLPDCTAAGMKDFKYQSVMTYPNNTSFALLAVDKKTNTVVAEVGQETTLVVKPGETLIFIINDVPGCYYDNTGDITVNWSGVSLNPKVLQFDGKNDFVEVPYNPQLNPNQFTVSCWAKVTGGQGRWRSPVTCRDASRNTCKGYKLYAGTNNKWQTWVGNGSNWQTLGGPDVVLNTWTHVAATYDGSDLKLYVNGNLAATRKTTYIPNTVYPLRIGTGASETNPPNYYFPGQIGEVSVWNVARTEQEIKADMSKRLTGKEANLVSYWPLNEVQQEGAIAKVLDLTSNLNGTVTKAQLVEDSTFPVS